MEKCSSSWTLKRKIPISTFPSSSTSKLFDLPDETNVDKANRALDAHHRSMQNGFFSIGLFLRYELEFLPDLDYGQIKFYRDHALTLLEESEVWFKKLGEAIEEYRDKIQMEETLNFNNLRTEDPD